jgi:predicted HicB family RNase H-like nuclease
MAQTKKANRKEYDTRTYKQYNFKVRRKSELYEKIEAAKDVKGVSLNYIITQQMAKYFDCPMPEPHLDVD